MVQGPVYIGRPSEWGNPFEVGRDGTREEVIQKHREGFLGQPELVERARRDLLCWCAPRKCHGELMTNDVITCPKCGQTSGNSWSQCEGRCPMGVSPWFDPTLDYGQRTEDRGQRTEDLGPGTWDLGPGT